MVSSTTILRISAEETELRNKNCRHEAEKDSRNWNAFHESAIALKNILTLICGSRQEFLVRVQRRRHPGYQGHSTQEDSYCR